jgi:hypothetical protein
VLILGKRRGLTDSQLAEVRNNRHEHTAQVYLDPNAIDEEYLNQFLGRIFFWSFGFNKTGPYTHSTKFRVCTHRFIPQHKLSSLVEGAFQNGCEVKPVQGYSFRHTFDVKTTTPLRWDEFVWRIVKALEGVL